jgi:hypothetical protein
MRTKSFVSAFLGQMVKQKRAREVPNPESCRLAFQKLQNSERSARINPTQPKESVLEIPTEALSQPQRLDQMKPMDVLMQAVRYIHRNPLRAGLVEDIDVYL